MRTAMRTAIGYAYATSEIADHFDHGQEGCAFLCKLDANNRRVGIIHTIGDSDNKAIEHMLKWATLNGIEIEPISHKWAESIVTIRQQQLRKDESMDNSTYNKLANFEIGDRVELHPATDAWMMGNRYGVITKLAKKHVHVKMDKTGRTLRLFPEYVNVID